MSIAMASIILATPYTNVARHHIIYFVDDINKVVASNNSSLLLFINQKEDEIWASRVWPLHNNWKQQPTRPYLWGIWQEKHWFSIHILNHIFIRRWILIYGYTSLSLCSSFISIVFWWISINTNILIHHSFSIFSEENGFLIPGSTPLFLYYSKLLPKQYQYLIRL